MGEAAKASVDSAVFQDGLQGLTRTPVDGGEVLQKYGQDGNLLPEQLFVRADELAGASPIPGLVGEADKVSVGKRLGGLVTETVEGGLDWVRTHPLDALSIGGAFATCALIFVSAKWQDMQLVGKPEGMGAFQHIARLLSHPTVSVFFDALDSHTQASCSFDVSGSARAGAETFVQGFRGGQPVGEPARVAWRTFSDKFSEIANSIRSVNLGDSGVVESVKGFLADGSQHLGQWLDTLHLPKHQEVALPDCKPGDIDAFRFAVEHGGVTQTSPMYELEQLTQAAGQ